MRCRKCGTVNNDNVRFCINCGNNTFISESDYSNRNSNTLKYVLIAVVMLVVVVSGSLAYIVFFDTSPSEVSLLNTKSGADVLDNQELAGYLPDSDITDEIIAYAGEGVPVYRIGDGSGPVSIITAGVHGDQLNPSVAAMQMVNYLEGRKIKGTVYIIPFVSPSAVSKNTKLTDGVNLNQAADNPGSISYDVVEFAIDNGAGAVGDFHETEIGKNPGVTTIMCTKIPNPNSYELADAMSQLSLDDTLTYLVAGVEYDGAIEDELNLKGVTAVTPLVQVSGHGYVSQGSVRESYTQMLALLYVNGNIDPDDSYQKLANIDIDGF